MVSENTAKTVEPIGRGRGREGVARARILDVATELFYVNGIRATSADRIIEQAGITKVTFYRYFRTKTDLVVAYLEKQAAAERSAMNSARDDADAARSLHGIAAIVGAASCMPGFRGCPFINAAAEIPDPADPVRIVVDSHREWTRDMFAAIAASAGIEDAGTTAGQLMMLRDGAMISGYLSDPAKIAERLQLGYVAIMTAAQHSA